MSAQPTLLILAPLAFLIAWWFAGRLDEHEDETTATHGIALRVHTLYRDEPEDE